MTMDSKPMINSATKIEENTLYDIPMVTSRPLHKLREFINRISNVWLGHRQILKVAENSAKLRRIRKGNARLKRQGRYGRQWGGD